MSPFYRNTAFYSTDSQIKVICKEKGEIQLYEKGKNYCQLTLIGFSRTQLTKQGLLLIPQSLLCCRSNKYFMRKYVPESQGFPNSKIPPNWGRGKLTSQDKSGKTLAHPNRKSLSIK